jgi:hypothetical protein
VIVSIAIRVINIFFIIVSFKLLDILVIFSRCKITKKKMCSKRIFPKSEGDFPY